jgi:hypothetical protein
MTKQSDRSFRNQLKALFDAGLISWTEAQGRQAYKLAMTEKADLQNRNVIPDEEQIIPPADEKKSEPDSKKPEPDAEKPETGSTEAVRSSQESVKENPLPLSGGGGGKPAKAKKPKAGDEPPPIIPDWMPEADLKAFLDSRRANGKPIKTNRALRGVVDEIARLRADGHCPSKLLRKAADRGWQFPYPGDDTLAAAPGRKMGTIERLMNFKNNEGEAA